MQSTFSGARRSAPILAMPRCFMQRVSSGDVVEAGTGPWKSLGLGSASWSRAAEQPRPQLPGEHRAGGGSLGRGGGFLMKREKGKCHSG